VIQVNSTDVIAFQGTFLAKPDAKLSAVNEEIRKTQ
jgi:hypothetical protein